MPDIILATLNAKFMHAAFGLRYLLANLGPCQRRAELVEFEIHQRPLEIAETLLARHPRLIGLGVYIWNVVPTTELVAILKRLRPEVTIVLGGPEVSYETEQQPIVALADYVITGEADLKFAEVCLAVLEGRPPAEKIIAAPVPDFSQLVLPYGCYTDRDLACRMVYVEASRGCPFSCEFCLSSLEVPVRQAPLEEFLRALQALLDRGARQLKFVDRTFNLNATVGEAILEFLLSRCQPGMLFHFEMIPDRLPEALRAVVAGFPPGALQFEIGIQSFDETVCQRISRRQDLARLIDNFHFLRRHTGVHLHADLIVGLPGESLAGFAAGFDRLVQLGPQEIQVGILKRLRGTPISRHDTAWAMVYNPNPPYDLLQNKLIDFTTMQRLRRFARYWDLVANSGNFIETTPRLWSADPSPFAGFLRWSDWLFAQVGRTDAIALPRLAEGLFQFLTRELHQAPRATAEALWRDYQRGGRRDVPEFLRPHLDQATRRADHEPRPAGMKRQRRHLARPTPVSPLHPVRGALGS